MAFTPFSALAGGALIGLSASLLLALDGRIAGISGIVGGLFSHPASGPDAAEEKSWRGAFLGGLFVGALGVAFVARHALTPSIPALPTGLTILAGLLVGVGTQLGSGCTSGHGVCGISRLSQRGVFATMTFMAVAVIATFVVRHVLHIGDAS